MFSANQYHYKTKYLNTNKHVFNHLVNLFG